MPERLHRELARRASEPAESRRRRGLRPIRDRDAFIFATLRRVEQARKRS